jgi:hypothetical protein
MIEVGSTTERSNNTNSEFCCDAVVVSTSVSLIVRINIMKRVIVESHEVSHGTPSLQFTALKTSTNQVTVKIRGISEKVIGPMTCSKNGGSEIGKIK